VFAGWFSASAHPFVGYYYFTH